MHEAHELLRSLTIVLSVAAVTTVALLGDDGDGRSG
jgi:hypothetical protein